MKQLLHLLPFVPTAIVLVAILYLSLASDPVPDSHRFLNFPGADKVVHAIMYMGLTAVFCFDYYRYPLQPRKRHLIAALLAAIAIGGAIEIIQEAMHTGRSGDLLDFAADTAGALLGLLIGTTLLKEWIRRKI